MVQFNTKCGCVYCKGEYVPDTRNAWKARRNKKGRTFGLHVKPRKATHRRPSKVMWTG